jgi:hypothetical protein
MRFTARPCTRINQYPDQRRFLIRFVCNRLFPSFVRASRRMASATSQARISPSTRAKRLISFGLPVRSARLVGSSSFFLALLILSDRFTIPPFISA